MYEELDKFLKETAEDTFLVYLDFFEDSEFNLHEDAGEYNFEFEDDEGITDVVLKFEKGALVYCSCSCDCPCEGHCVHELAAMLAYIKLYEPEFDIIDYLVRVKKNDPGVWLKPMVDNFNIEDMMHLDIHEMLGSFSKEQILDILEDINADVPFIGMALFNYFNPIDELDDDEFDEGMFSLEDFEFEDFDDEDEDDDEYPNATFIKTCKPN